MAFAVPATVGFTRSFRPLQTNAATRRRASKAALSMVHLVGISGSLRKASTNTGLLRYIASTMPKGTSFEILDISDFPMYSEDIEAQGIPPPVLGVAEKVRKADGVIFGCCEYNYCVSGAMANAHNWMSRASPGNPVFAGKAGGIVSSAGGLGGARAQEALRISGIFLQIQFVVGREVLINQFVGEKKFDKNGDLIDPTWQERVRTYADGVIDLARKLKA